MYDTIAGSYEWAGSYPHRSKYLNNSDTEERDTSPYGVNTLLQSRYPHRSTVLSDSESHPSGCVRRLN